MLGLAAIALASGGRISGGSVGSPLASGSPLPVATLENVLQWVTGRHLVWSDDFSGKRVDARKWWVYDGPGNEGNGVRSPSQVTEAHGAVTITCTTAGRCGGMMAKTAQKYGTWAARVKMSPASANVHPVLLLWPKDDVWPSHGEIDYMEVTDPSRHTAEGFLHFGAKNAQNHGQVKVDLTQWHVFSVTWTPTSIAYYVDGHRWLEDMSRSHQPPVAMNPTIQLDDAGGPITQGGTMTVDWLRIYNR